MTDRYPLLSKMDEHHRMMRETRLLNLRRRIKELEEDVARAEQEPLNPAMLPVGLAGVVEDLDDREAILRLFFSVLGENKTSFLFDPRDFFRIDQINRLCMYFKIELPAWFAEKYGQTTTT